jgi:hypothetical protein
MGGETISKSQKAETMRVAVDPGAWVAPPLSVRGFTWLLVLLACAQFWLAVAWSLR